MKRTFLKLKKYRIIQRHINTSEWLILAESAEDARSKLERHLKSGFHDGSCLVEKRTIHDKFGETEEIE